MHEDDFLEMRYEDLHGVSEDPVDYDTRDFDDEEPFFSDDPEWEDGFIQEYDRP